MQPTEQFNGLVFDMCGTVQQIGNIVIRLVRADGTAGKTSQAGLATIATERRRFTDRNCIHRAEVKTRRTFRILILRMQAAFGVQNDLRTV
jgi:hypothetical protein